MNNQEEPIVVHIGFEVWKGMCSQNSNLTRVQQEHLLEIEKLRLMVKQLTEEVEQLRKSPSYEQLAQDNGELIRIGMSMADAVDAANEERPECVKEWYAFNGWETDSRV